MNNLKDLATFLDTISIIYIIITLIEFIAIILIAHNVSKIKDIECKPFQNKKPDYPAKVLELLQSILVTQQNQSEEIKKLKSIVEISNNKGVIPGMKSKEASLLEEITQLHKQQIELLSKILNTTNGEEKKKLMEKWKQATDLLNDIE